MSQSVAIEIKDIGPVIFEKCARAKNVNSTVKPHKRLYLSAHKGLGCFESDRRRSQMPKRMIVPIAFILMTLFFIVKGFYNSFFGEQTGEERRQAESLQKTQEQREYDLKLQACIKQQNDYRTELDAKGQLYSIEQGLEIDNSFKLLSDECKMMIILWEKESGIISTGQKENSSP